MPVKRSGCKPIRLGPNGLTIDYRSMNAKEAKRIMRQFILGACGLDIPEFTVSSACLDVYQGRPLSLVFTIEILSPKVDRKP